MQDDGREDGDGSARRVAIRGRRHGPPRPSGRWLAWLREPRSAVLIVLAGVILAGGGRRLLHAWRARRILDEMERPDVGPERINELVGFGRAGLVALFRLLASAETAPAREAAGRALATLWARDELIAEEEKALVRRGFEALWKARRRYPRAIQRAIPIVVDYGIPFLRDGGSGVGPAQLEWSHRITGARRASLETFTPWKAGSGRASFTIVPTDFDTPGPHRLVLQARVRTVGLTDAWEFELPHVPFTLEFDPQLSLEALLALPDETRRETFRQAVRLERLPAEPEAPAGYADLNAQFALRAPPVLVAAAPLPCDLAHRVELEFAETAGRYPAGEVITSGFEDGQKPGNPRQLAPVVPEASFPSELISRPGCYRVRAVLTPDPERGWADPDVRSIWPEAIATDWAEVEIVRR